MDSAKSTEVGICCSKVTLSARIVAAFAMKLHHFGGFLSGLWGGSL